jgi:deoxyribonuclease V
VSSSWGLVVFLERLEALQKSLACKVVLADDFGEIKLIAGVDEAFIDDLVLSGIVVLDYETLEVVESVFAVDRVRVPYIPGFLSFREGEVIVKAWKLLSHLPEVLVVDGCGVNHPRGMGLASYVGVELDVATIGVSKGVLCGRGVMPKSVGEAQPLCLGERQVGWLVKSTVRSNPIVVAPGHRVSVNSSLEIIRHCLRGYKLPEPTRLAHRYVKGVREELKEKLERKADI